jgi:pimeloyl-ACP methyl ester carboxylesterase
VKIIREISLLYTIILFCSSSAKADDSYNPKIDTLMDIELNGLKQKILIQSNNKNNPILLWLHGGPGTSEMFINHHCMNKLIDFYTVVHWDQRGTALSYNDSLTATEITHDKILDDAIRLTELLIEIYHQDKIFIIGHSFGSILGIHLILKYPDSYYAYIGMGQLIDDDISREITYNWFVNKLKDENDSIELAEVIETHRIPRDLIDKYRGIYYKGRSLFDIIKDSPYYYDGYFDTYLKSMNFIRESLSKDTTSNFKNIFNEVRELQVPVYFFEGRHDRIAACAPELVIEYCKNLTAPKKEIIWFEESAHHPNLDEPDKFQKVLIDKVLKDNYKK